MNHEHEYSGMVPLDDEASTFVIVVKDRPFGVDLRELHRELWSGQ